MTQYIEPRRIYAAKCMAVSDDIVTVNSNGQLGLDIVTYSDDAASTEVMLTVADSLKLRDALNEWYEKIKGELPCAASPATPA